MKKKKKKKKKKGRRKKTKKNQIHEEMTHRSVESQCEAQTSNSLSSSQVQLTRGSGVGVL